MKNFHACLNQQGQVKPRDYDFAPWHICKLYPHLRYDKTVSVACSLFLFPCTGQQPRRLCRSKRLSMCSTLHIETACVSIERHTGDYFYIIRIGEFGKECLEDANLCITWLFCGQRELGLHSLDHPSNAHLATSARAEIGRRV